MENGARMDTELLQTVGQIAGIGGLAIAVLLLVFRDIVAKNIFPQLKKDHAYGLLRLISILVFVVAIAGIGAWVFIETDDAGRTAGTDIEPDASAPSVEASGGSVAAGGNIEGSTITIHRTDVLPSDDSVEGENAEPAE